LTEAEVEIIDTFFQSLQWDIDLSADATVEPTVDLISYGNLMELLDMNNRWIYQGSMTIPPCETFVYWNVLSTVYPIKQEHLDQFVTN
jgi:carbonic anhydrase